MNKNRVTIVGQMLMDLAEQLSDEDCEITADDILENLECQTISEEDAGEIGRWLAT